MTLPELPGRRRHEPEIHTGGGTVALIRGLTFAISQAGGDIVGGHSGVIASDTRHISRLVLRVDGEPVSPLGTTIISPSSARFSSVAATRDGTPDAPLEVSRLREVAAGQVTDTIRLDWWAPGERDVEVAVTIDADFADIFEIRALDVHADGEERRHLVDVTWGPDGVRFHDTASGLHTSVAFDPQPTQRTFESIVWIAHVARNVPWELRMTVTAHSGDPTTTALEPIDASVGTVVRSEPMAFGRACRCGLADLNALSLPDELDPTRQLTAAGIPWFVALFGRDSLIAAHQARAFRPDQLLDTLEALAVRQGTDLRPENDEAPGKILHEVRLTPRQWLGEGTMFGGRPYFGTIDATPLFLMAYGEAFRWGAPRSAMEALLPAARAALGWLRGPADLDGDGLIEYFGAGPRSLRNQGWKDSVNGVQFADGTLAEGPIAVVEAQGYAYRGRRELAGVLRAFGEDGEASELEAEAEVLRETIRERFWIAGVDGRPGYFAMALDGDKRQVDAVSSNMAHLLWCSVPSPEEATQMVEHLVSPELASGWGLRTLSSAMAGYNPVSYHAGSVWPHDTAIACEGLRRCGFTTEALQLAGALLDALHLFDLRLPELYGGHTRTDNGAPIPYPTACRPQAWAAGVPLSLAMTFLGIVPRLEEGRIAINPALPEAIEVLTVRDIPFPTGRLSVKVEQGGATEILEAPGGLVIEVVSD